MNGVSEEVRQRIRHGLAAVRPRPTALWPAVLTLLVAGSLCATLAAQGRAGGRSQRPPKPAARKGAPPKPAPVFRVYTEPPGAEVTINGQLRGVTNEKGELAVDGLARGRHSLSVRRAGYKEFDGYVTVGADGGEHRVQLEKELLTLVVKTLPGAQVAIDGVARGEADNQGSLAVENLGPGPHSIAVRLRGYSDAMRSYTLASHRAVAELIPPADPYWPVVIRFEEALGKGEVTMPANRSALASYQRLLRENPAHPELTPMRAKLLQGIEQRGQQLQKEIGYRPGQRLEALREARSLYETASAIQPNSRHTVRMRYYDALLSWREAGRRERERRVAAFKQELRRAVEIDPTFAPAHHDLAALAYDEAGDYAAAARGLKAAAEAAPQWALPHFTLGRIYLDQDRSAEAVLAFEKALKLDARLSQAKAGLGAALALRGDRAAGLMLAEQAAVEARDSAYAHYALARAYTEAGNFSAAGSAMDRALRLNEPELEFNSEEARRLLKEAQKRRKR